VLGVAMAPDGGNMKHLTEANLKEELSDVSNYKNLESNCSFVGFVCIKDPVRP
jgi:magnesium-transporting ATPase (P-type)